MLKKHFHIIVDVENSAIVLLGCYLQYLKYFRYVCCELTIPEGRINSFVFDVKKKKDRKERWKHFLYPFKLRNSRPSCFLHRNFMNFKKFKFMKLFHWVVLFKNCMEPFTVCREKQSLKIIWVHSYYLFKFHLCNIVWCWLDTLNSPYLIPHTRSCGPPRWV